jgi:PleD family two-component response regulator
MSQHTPLKAPDAHPASDAPEFASILIVDDQRFDRKHLRKLCASLKFTTHIAEACSLAALRDMLRKDRFDLILLDYHLTDGTGLDGVEIIRADRVNRDAATVMITGTDQRDIAIRALKLGFTDYLKKDELCAETLTRAAIVALQKSQLARGLSAQTAPPTAMQGTLQQFSRECAQDIKPIVSRMMRQMRELREVDNLTPEHAAERFEQIEGSMRRLWVFLDELDHLGGPPPAKPSRPVLPAVNGVKARVPTLRPEKSAPKSNRPPSVFRRRPD